MKLTKKQRQTLRDFLTVIAITSFAIFLLFNFKDMVNKTESMKVMQQLGNIITEYREDRGIVPPESYIEDVQKNVPGFERLGNHLHYRGIWLDYQSNPNDIIAYSVKSYRNLLVEPGVIILRLDGSVEYVSAKEFEKIMQNQMSEYEREYMKKDKPSL